MGVFGCRAIPYTGTNVDALFQENRVARRCVAATARGICDRFILTSAQKPISLYLWKFSAVPCSSHRQCGITCQRGHSAMAAQCFLDAFGAELHALDDWSVRVDVLRSLSAPRPPQHVSRRHCFLSTRHSADGGVGATAASQTGRASPTVRLLGLCAVNCVVDLSIRLHRSAVDVR